MRAHFIQHDPLEDLAGIEPWLVSAGYEITSTPIYESTDLPDIADIDFLILMGGPMSVNDEETLTWLKPEKEYLRKYIESGKPVLGICLGSQLIVNAMGANVYPGENKEIGWFPVKPATDANENSFQFPESTDVFHWHGETFDLPEGAILLASSEGCKNQAFQLGASAIGLQFHIETTPKSAKMLAEQYGDELIPAKYIQSKQDILEASDEKYVKNQQLMSEILAFLTGTN
ncbi:type 1 glutamine amidotransferase [Thiomicrorhabdus sp. ZW0627]|uniref:type 1 glutamine amidotransferase n=1 Tax=Thiomicrorhabdus sp. ZW0627 TaxID=3039774 RepID=UPI0024363ECA|nr:type 1 glutamine amidotransferase [Thiomicrorhabdus sp. ZW0627]MDG6773873.1 type 1 glutamine amidotransferase [Thiomicrorhabdus sp. ZW0627]